MILVVDASIACKWFVEEGGSAKANRLLEGKDILIAPDLIIPEVSNVLWRKLRAAQITSTQAAMSVEALPAFFDDVIPSARLASRSFIIAETLGHPVYDCFYVALAELRDAQLVTADRELLGRVAKTSWRRFTQRI